ncbi:MAG: MBL fold metallo-hydrolase [Chloroflexi bacterium]|nr:MBL fold metallo-hydrolase [Chloroflexota bacterium]MQC27141.1 MBL fold metallo-hydrolase [Chloroflexota bacterium]
MQHERVADNVYVFQSELYAQVTAGVVAGPDMAVVIDTLALPEETHQLRDFIRRELRVPVKYVINTHYHADHTWGNSLFQDALVVSHRLCHDLLESRGIPSLAEEKKSNPQLRELDIVLPHITFEEGGLTLLVGKKTLKLFSLPGHSPDNIAVLVEEDRVLFSGDTYMPLPYLVDGDIEQMITSLKRITKMGLENLVPGHGDIVLRGEIDSSVKSNLDYLNEIRKIVRQASRRKYPWDLLETFEVNDAGKSRVLVGGMADQLHRNNLAALYRYYYDEIPQGSEIYYE